MNDPFKSAAEDIVLNGKGDYLVFEATVALIEEVLRAHLGHLTSEPGVMHIAEGDEGWRNAEVDCPMLEAVYKLRFNYESINDSAKPTIKEVLACTPSTGWVIVEERLPEPYEYVFVWNKIQKTISIIRNYPWHENFSAGITHWHPMLKPPGMKEGV